MRHFRLFICIILITITLSCSEDFLTEYPKGVYSKRLFYNKKDAGLLLIGAYALIEPGTRLPACLPIGKQAGNL